MKIDEFQNSLKMFDNGKKDIKPKPKPKKKETSKFSIIPGKDILLKEIGKIKVYKYQNEPFLIEENIQAKILLIIGNAKDDFINTFINIYTNLPYNEENRLSIETMDNKYFTCYDIISRTTEKNNNIKIFALPHLEEDDVEQKKI